MTAYAPYALDHQDPNGPGDARPTALKIIRDEGLDGKLSGKVFLVTGCTSGIGIETARALHATGADVYITGRDEKKGQLAVEKICRDGKPGKVVFIPMHMDSLEGVRSGVQRFLSLSTTINGLICNAGVAFHPNATTKDGFEMHFGVNHLAHFLLFQELRTNLTHSASPDFPSRVVMVSSYSHSASAPDLNDVNFLQREYDPEAAYGSSKTANIWMSNEIERRFGHQHLHANAVHPGAIFTEAGRHLGDAAEKLFEMQHMARVAKSAEQGAATTVWAAVAENWKHQGGRYLADVQEGVPLSNETNGEINFAPHAFNEKAEKDLWDLSCRLVA